MSAHSPQPTSVRTFVIRIYRCGDGAQPPSVAGTIEPIPGGDRLAIDGLQQLGGILALPPSHPHKTSPRKN